jgi:hypothetical protein
MRLTIFVLSLCLLPIFLFGGEPDPFVGKWKLNWERSHSSQPQPKSVVRMYQLVKNGVRVREAWVQSDGKQTKVDYTANYDGQDYPIPSQKGATVAFKRTDPNTVEGVSKSNGKTNYTFKRYVSDSGKTLTLEMMRVDSAGKPSTEVLVYDKVR